MITTPSTPSRTARNLLVAALAALVAGCGSTNSIVIQDKKYEYRRAEQTDPLEVPPDLSASGIDERLAVPDIAPRETATFSAYSAERSGVSGEAVLTEIEGVSVERSGNQRWLVINASPSKVWDATRRFWVQTGFTLKREDSALGILETEWHENSAAVPASPIRSMLGKLVGPLMSTPIRDRFRVRLEAGADGMTELFLTHQGLREETGDLGAPVWVHRPSDPELEAEMLYRIMTFWGAEQGVARAGIDRPAPDVKRAELADDGRSLLLRDEFSRAWRRLGVALDRIGFAVEDRDRSGGTYLVRYSNPEGETKRGLSRLAFWRITSETDEGRLYNVVLQPLGTEQSRVTIADEAGVAVDSDTAQRILTLLHEELR